MLKENPYAAGERSDQMNFVRKVYAILVMQLIITFGWVAAVQSHEPLRKFVADYNWIGILTGITAVGLICPITCCLGRKYPINQILVLIFTICMAYTIGGMTASVVSHNTVIMAVLSTALVVIALLIYSFRTNVKIELLGALAMVIVFALIPLIVVSSLVLK